MLSFLSNFGKQKKTRKKSSGYLQRMKSMAARHLAVEPLERRELLTILYWDTNGAASGFGNGTLGAWNSTATNWTYNAQGTEATRAWIPGSDAVISAGASDLILLSAPISANSIQVNSGILQSRVGGSLNSNVLMTVNGTFDLNGGNTTLGGLTGSGTIKNTSISWSTLTVAGDNNRSDGFYGKIISNINLAVTVNPTNPTGSYTLNFCGNLNSYLGTTDVSTTGPYNVSLVNGTSNGLSPYSPVTVGNHGYLGLWNQNAQIPSLSGSGGTVFNWYTGTSTNTLTLTGTANTAFSGSIQNESGTSLLALAKTGSGIQTLSGNNTYSGATTVSAGTLQAGSSTAFSPASVLTVNGGVVDLNGNNVTVGGLNSSASAGVVANNATGTAAVLTTNGDNRFDHYYGTLRDSSTGSGGTLGLTVINTKTNPTAGNNLFLCSTGNNYSGATNIRNGTYGSSLLNSTTNALSPNSSINIEAGSILYLDTFDAQIRGLEGAGYVFNWSGVTSTNTLTVNNTNDKTFSGYIQDLVSTSKVAIAKNGSGKLTLSGNNTYTGSTTVTAGTLQAGSATGFSANSPLTVNGGVVDLNGNNISVVGLNSSPSSTTGVVANNLVDTRVTLTVFGDNRYDQYYGMLKDYTGSSGGMLGLTVTDTIANPVGTNYFYLRNNGNTYSGPTNVVFGTAGATLINGTTNGLSRYSSIYVGSQCRLALGDWNAEIPGLEGTGTVFNWQGGTVTSTLTINNTTDKTFAGTISDGSPTTITAIAKTGPGKLTITGTDTFTGGTTVNAGILEFGNGTTNASFNGNVTVASNGTLQFNNGTNQTYSGLITNSGTVSKQGSGTLTISNSSAISGEIRVLEGGVTKTGTGTTFNLGISDSLLSYEMVDVYVTWQVASTTSARFAVYNGTTELTPAVTVNQTVAPSGKLINGQYYRYLGQYHTTWDSPSDSHSLTVKLTNGQAGTTMSAMPAVFVPVDTPLDILYSLPSAGEGIVKTETNSTDGSLQTLFTPFGLIYNSAQVDPNHIITGDIRLQTTNGWGATLTRVDVQASINYGPTSDPVYYDGSTANADTYYRFAISMDLSLLDPDSDIYAWNMTIKQHYSDGREAEEIVVGGRKEVVNRYSSLYGQGWWMSDLDYLALSDLGPLNWVRGDGNITTFYGSSNTGYWTEPGDSAFVTISGGNGGYTIYSKDGSYASFDANGRLSYRSNVNGNRTDYQYDANGRLISKTLPDNTSFTYTYSNGKLDTITDPAGKITTFGFTGSQLTTITQPDPDGDLTEYIAPVTSFGYDSAGRMTSLMNAATKTTSFDYGLTDGTRHTTITYPNINTNGNSTVTLDPVLVQPLVLTLNDPSHLATLVSADSVQGSITDQLNYSTSFKVNRYGQPTSVTNALSETTSYVYDNNGLLTKMTQPDPDGAGSQPAPVWRYSYDAQGNITREVLPDGSHRDWTYQACQSGTYIFYQIKTYTDEYNKQTIYSIDTAGNINSVRQVVAPCVDFDDVITSFTYTPSPDSPDAPDGLIDTVTDALGRVTKYYYDNHGNATDIYTVYSVDGSNNIHYAGHTKYEYDPAGNVSKKHEYVDNGNGSEIDRVTDYDYDALGRLKLVAPSIGPNTIYIYDEMNRVYRSIEDIESVGQRTTEYNYYDNGLLHTVTLPDPDGAGDLPAPIYSYEYYDNGQLHKQSEFAPADNTTVTTTYIYDEAGQLSYVRVPNPNNVVENIETGYLYDHLGRVKQVTDPLNNVTLFDYSNYGLTVTETDPDPDGPSNPLTSPVTVANYNWEGLVTSATDARNYTTTYQYDDLYRLSKVIQPVVNGSAPTTSYSYYKDGSLQTVTDPLGNTTKYTYDYVALSGNALASNLRVTETLPNPATGSPQNSSIIYRTVYNPVGEVLTESNPVNATTKYAYDALGRVTSVTQPDPDGNDPLPAPVTTYSYTNSGVDTGDLYSVTSPAGTSVGSTMTYQYDALHRVTQTVNSFTDTVNNETHNDTTDYAYDRAGNVKYVTDPTAGITTYQYDPLHRLTDIILPNPTNGSAGSSLTTHYTYDALSNLQTTTDALGNTVTNAYDNLGRLHTVTQPNPLTGQANAGPVTTYGYDAAGNLTSLKDPNNYTTSYQYDPLNRVTQATDPNNHSTLYQYNAGSQLTQVTDRNNRVTNYAYDHLGRETQETWKDTPTGSITHTFTYSYDICSRIQNASDTVGSTANSSYAYTYDYLDRARTITATLANLTPTVTLTQQFDADSNRTQLSAAIGTTNDFINNYQYANDRMTQVTQSGSASGGSNTVDPKRVDISYTNNGQIHTISSYSDLTNSASKLASTATYTYDRASRLTNLSYNLPWVSGTDPAYTLNYDDNGRLHQFTSATDGTTATYAYDHTNQLTGVTGDGTESYNYDNAGNRTGGNYTSTTGNRLTHDADNNLLEYDNEGNRIRKTAANGLTKTEYSYDHRNRLTESRSFTWTGGAWVQGYTIDYRYDVFDRLVGKTVDVTHDGVIDASAAYIYDGQNMILRFNHSGSGSVTAADLKRRFLYGPAVDQVFAEDIVGTSTTRWTLADQEGSIRDVAEYNYSTGTYTSTMVDHLHYDSYGNFTQTNSAYQPMFTYTGRWYDGESQLYYYRARWYDPKSGRFLSEDPAGFAAGDANLFRYCGNSPTNYTDPSGMYPYSGGSGGGDTAENGWDGHSDHYSNPLPPSDPRRTKQQNIEDQGEADWVWWCDPEQHGLPPEEPESTNSVGEPGFAESLLPVWGSGRSAYNNFQTGHWGWGIFYTGMAITDLFMVKALATAGGKALVAGGIKLIGREAAETGGKDLATVWLKDLAETRAKNIAEAGLKDIGEAGAKDAADLGLSHSKKIKIELKAPESPGRFEPSPKHHLNSTGEIGKPPTNGQSALDGSLQIKWTSPRRISVDPKTGEFVVLDQTRLGIFHGHVRTWEELTPEMKKILIDSGKVTKKGKLL